MTRRELERGIKTFDLQKFFLKDTSKISEYSAILVITDNQLILTENGDHGRDYHIDTLADICKIIYDIPEMGGITNWSQYMKEIERQYASNLIWARLSNENSEPTFWIIFPETITQNQYNLFATWAYNQNNISILTEVEEHLQRAFVGFRGLTETGYGLEQALDYASTLIREKEVWKPIDMNIVGKTIADFTTQKVSKKVKV